MSMRGISVTGTLSVSGAVIVVFTCGGVLFSVGGDTGGASVMVLVESDSAAAVETSVVVVTEVGAEMMVDGDGAAAVMGVVEHVTEDETDAVWRLGVELQMRVDVGTGVRADGVENTGDAGGASASTETEAEAESESVLVSGALVDWGVWQVLVLTAGGVSDGTLGSAPASLLETRVCGSIAASAVAEESLRGRPLLRFGDTGGSPSSFIEAACSGGVRPLSISGKG